MKAVSSFFLMVHPDYHAIHDQNFLMFHPEQVRLREVWEAKAQEVKAKEDSVLIYVSTLEHDELTRGLSDPELTGHAVKKEELKRILRWGESLDNRFILVPNKIDLAGDFLKSQLRDRGFGYIPSEAKLTTFGEYFELCVNEWSEAICTSLRIPEKNVFLDRERSLCPGWIREIHRWRTSKER